MDLDTKGSKPWRCKNGHALGLVVGDRLLLFRLAIEPEDLLSAEKVDVMAVVVGQVVNVRCSICGKLRTWVQLEPKRSQYDR